ncbi:unnamed protein product [Lactuca virosa]|uniref:Uncharacterized protein n=1 Tax=Lactuca virosa TaxID=75947 RepID=A0AAU9MU87_9ASTR|nr:unnamed protein product [Lactuca virosa]
MQLVEHIKMRLQDENHLYIYFLFILNLYRMGKLSANEVHKNVADLFQDHHDLITEFTNFLSQCHANSIGTITLAMNTQAHQQKGEVFSLKR